jgi:hypothetical protein
MHKQYHARISLAFQAGNLARTRRIQHLLPQNWLQRRQHEE